MSISTDITRIKNAKAALKTAINSKGGSITTGLLDTYAAAVDAIAVMDTSDATAVQGEILATKTAYIATGKVTGTMPDNAGDVNAVSYHADGTSIHVIPALGYTDGSDDASIITDSDFVAGNIKDGVNIFGKAGTYTGGSATWSNSSGSNTSSSGGVFSKTGLSFAPKVAVLTCVYEATTYVLTYELVGTTWYLSYDTTYHENATSDVTATASSISINIDLPSVTVTYSISGF